MDKGFRMTRNDTALLKGVAIAAIVLHNFCHWLPGCVVECEFTFHASQFARWLDAFLAGQSALLNMFSYFGHYGVPVFLFASGYGLVAKYETAQGEAPALPRFMAQHAAKLYRLMLPVLLAWLVLTACSEAGLTMRNVTDAAALAAFVANLLPQPHLHMPLGPWWWFSLMMQLYLVYRLLIYRRSDGWIGVLAVVGAVALTVAVATTDRGQTGLNYVRYNCVGNLWPFLLGVWMARHHVRPRGWWAIWAAPLLLAGCTNVWLWLFTPTLFVVALLPIINIRCRCRAAFEWLGGLSAMLFVVHPLVRPTFISMVKNGGSPYVALGLYLLGCMALALFLRFIIRFYGRKTKNDVTL